MGLFDNRNKKDKDPQDPGHPIEPEITVIENDPQDQERAEHVDPPPPEDGYTAPPSGASNVKGENEKGKGRSSKSSSKTREPSTHSQNSYRSGNSGHSKKSRHSRRDDSRRDDSRREGNSHRRDRMGPPPGDDGSDSSGSFSSVSRDSSNNDRRDFGIKDVHWLIDNNRHVKACYNDLLGHSHVEMFIQIRGNDGHLNYDKRKTIIDSCKKYMQTIDAERRNLEFKFAQQLELAQEKSKKVYDSKILEDMFAGIQDDSEIKPPTNFGLNDGSMGFNSPTNKGIIDKAFKLPRHFTGNQRDMTIFEFLSHMNRAQEALILSEHDFTTVLLNNTSGPAFQLIQSLVSVGKSVGEIYKSLLGTYDQRISIAEAEAKIKAYKISKNTSFQEACSEITQLCSRASQGHPKQVRNEQYDFTSYQTLGKALPSESSQLVTDTYHKLSQYLGRNPTFNEITKALQSAELRIDADIKAKGSDVRADANMLKDSNKKGKDRSNQNSKQSSNKRVNVVGKSSTQPKDKGKQSSQNQQKSPGKKVNALTHQRGSNQTQGKYQNNRNGNWCTFCGLQGHTVNQGCRAAFTNSGVPLGDQVGPSTCGYCEDCIKNFDKKLRHPQEYCPWRSQARKLYASGAKTPVGLFRKAWEERMKNSADI